MIKVKASTKRGQQLITMGSTCIYRDLTDLYFRPSNKKQEAFNWCWEQYSKSPHASAFGIGNPNSFSFTASWNTVVDGQPCMRIETKDNSYLVYYDL